MRLVLVVAAMLICSGCVLPSSMQELKMANAKLADDVRLLETGAITTTEFNNRIDQYDDRLDEIYAENANKIKDIADSTLSMAEVGGIGGVVTGIGGTLLHLYRNSTRRREEMLKRLKESEG